MYLILVLVGTTTLLPWNVYITEKEFFDVRLHVKPTLPGVANNFMAVFSLVFNASNLGALLLMNAFRAQGVRGSRKGAAGQALPSGRALLPTLLVVFVILAGTAALSMLTQVT